MPGERTKEAGLFSSTRKLERVEDTDGFLGQIGGWNDKNPTKQNKL